MTCPRLFGKVGLPPLGGLHIESDHRFYERGLSRKNYPLAGCDSIFLQPATFPMHRELPKAGSGLPHAAGYDLAHRFLFRD